MPNSVERYLSQRKTNLTILSGPMILLLNVVLEYKTARTMVNVDWETCQTKYADILDLFRAQCFLVIKQTLANACLFNARDTLLTVLVQSFYVVFIFSRFRCPHENDIYPCKYFHTLAVVFKFTRFVWEFYSVWTEAVTVKIFTRFQIYTGTCGRGLKVVRCMIYWSRLASPPCFTTTKEQTNGQKYINCNNFKFFCFSFSLL